MEQPLVSVLMTAYNREKYIAEAIESVIASTYQNWELIIVDDGSKDKTVEIAKSYEAKDKRIKVYVNEKNLGDYPNRNKAASYARGKYIMFVDSDDKTLPEGITNCVEVMLQFPQASFGIHAPILGKEVRLIKQKEAIKNHFFVKPYLMSGPGGTIIETSFFRKINSYPTKYGPANDLYFNLKVACYSDVVTIPFDFLYYRIHEGQEMNNKFSYLYNNYLLLKDAITELPLGLNKYEIEWIVKKRNRRFLVNILKYFFNTFNFSKSNEAIKKTGYTFMDAIKGIFH